MTPFAADIAQTEGAGMAALPDAVAIWAGGRIMPGETQKIRLAVTVFYDMESLESALANLLALDVPCDSLLLAGRQDTVRHALALQGVVTGTDGTFDALSDDIVPIAETPRGLRLWGTGGENCLQKLISGEIGAHLQDHAEKGAVIVAAKTPTPALQDLSVRVFLKYSQHTVHSCEWPVET
ncbi:MAG: hypothetical protein HC850_08970 [Rhodomicrobium sp.]|nr:hypothetical protein [Rhodomicrobium sp.]